MDKNEGLKKIHEKWFVDCNCELKKTATSPVPGDGNPNSEIVFIGEAPGKEEDKQGRPFVGAAGKFLAEMLETIKLRREEVYITNIVKYRPPNNRDPLPEEKDACRDWLIEELNFINPKLIVFLGRHSMNDFFPTEKISAVHGKLLIKKFNKIETKHFLPLYHPAAALYNGGMRETLVEDFKKIPKILEKIKNEVRLF
jgi:DNA polymerase